MYSIGDTVEFELDPTGKVPRYTSQEARDRGASGTFVKGEVIEAKELSPFKTHLRVELDSGDIFDFDVGTYLDRPPGYLRVVRATKMYGRMRLIFKNGHYAIEKS